MRNIRKKYEAGGNFQSGVYATGGEVRRFNRHEQMDSATREEIMDVIQDLEIRNPLTNYLYGLFDGYDYSKTKNFKIQMNKLRAKDFSLHKRIKEIYSKIDKYKFDKYDSFSDGGYFDGTIPKVSTYMTNFAKGGGLDSHGIKQGDTFLKTLSGGIQKVKDKNGNIFYINLATGERSATIPLPFDDGGEVKYFLNKDGIRVRSVAKPEKKISEREWMAKHNESKEARSYAFGGLFGKSPMMSKPKKINLNDKQVRLNSGEYVQVLDQDGDTLMVMELSKIGTGASPKMVKIDDVDMTSFAGGGDISERKRYTVGDLKNMGFKQFKGDKMYLYYFQKDGNNYEFKKIPTIGINSGFVSENETVLALVQKYANGGGVVGNKYKILQDAGDIFEQGFYLVVDTKQNKIINLFEFKKEAQDYIKEINEVGIKKADASKFNGQIQNYANGGETYREKASQLKGGLDYYSIDIDLFNGDEIRDLTFKSLDEAKKEYLKYSNSMVYDGDDIMDIQLIAVYKNGDYENINLNKGGALIGNQKRIDMNHNGRIDAEDFKLLRSSMNGAWRKEHKYVNSTSRKDGKVIDYEVRYARKNNPSRKGYKGKTNYADGGDLKGVKLDFNLETDGDYEDIYETEVEKIKLLREVVDFDEVVGNIDTGKTFGNTDLKFYKNDIVVMTIYGNYDTESETLDSKVDVLGNKYNINYHLLDTMGGFDSSKFKKEIEKIDYKKKKSKRDWLSFVKDNSSYFDVEEESEESVTLTTRENGNVGDEEYGIEDIEEAKSIVKKIKEKYPKTKVSIYTVDEFVYLELENTNEPEKELAKGGAFEKLSNKVAKNYEGKRVKPQYQKEYGKVYSKSEAKEVGDKVAGKVKAMQKMATGGGVSNFKIGDEITIIKPFPNGDMTGKKGKIVELSANNTGVIYILVDGKRIAVLSEYISKNKMNTGGATKKGGQGGIMVLAKKIRKEGESWQDALKRAGQQLK